VPSTAAVSSEAAVFFTEHVQQPWSSTVPANLAVGLMERVVCIRPERLNV
jgi:hypothetical protein